LKDGTERRVWIDAATFLESKIEGNPRRLDGRMRKVENTLRDWRKVGGVLIPFESETKAETAPPRKMTLDKVVLNPPLDEQQFGKPAVPAAKGPSIASGSAAGGRPTQPAAVSR
jgi:hypothetical protein